MTTQVSQLEFMVFMLQEMRLATAEDVDRILGIFHSCAHPIYIVLFFVCVLFNGPVPKMKWLLRRTLC